MRERVSVREVMRRDYVGVSESDSVRGAAELMYADGMACAVVQRGNDPVGVLTAEDVLGLVSRADDSAETTVGAVMREPVVGIDADRPLDDAMAMMADRDVRQLVVRGDDGIAGVLSEHDLLTANTVLPGAAAEERQATAIGETGTTITEAVDEEEETPEPYAQGVCEVCGSLTAELRDVNGQLVCMDCRSV